MDYITATPVLRPRETATSTSLYLTDLDGCVVCPSSLSCPSCPSGQECQQKARTCTLCPEYVCVATETKSGSSTSIGGIIGGVVGGIAVVAVVGLFLFYKLVYRKKHPRLPDEVDISEIKLDGSESTGGTYDEATSALDAAERPVAQRSQLSNSITKNHRLSAYETFMRPPRAGKRPQAGPRRAGNTRAAGFTPYGDGDLSKRNSVATTISTTNALNILPIAYIPGVTIRPTKNNTRSIYLYDTDSVFSDFAGIDQALIVQERLGNPQARSTMTAIKAQPKLVNVARIDEDEEEDEEELVAAWNETNLTNKLLSVVTGSHTADTLSGSIPYHHDSEPDSDVDSDIGEIHRATSTRRPREQREQRDDESGSFVLDISRANP